MRVEVASEGTGLQSRGGGDGFAAFVAEAEPRLRRALVARFGAERGREATAEALAWAFEHWSDVEGMANGVGYLYRVGVSRTRERKPIEVARAAVVSVRSDGSERAGPAATDATTDDPGLDPELWAAVMALSDNQRLAVVLVHAYGWPMREVADLLDISVPTVGTHLRRGLLHLRERLGRTPANEEASGA